MAKEQQARAFRDQTLVQLKDVFDLAVEARDVGSAFAKSMFLRRFQRLDEIRDTFLRHHESIIGILAAANKEQALAAEYITLSNFDKMFFEIESIYFTLVPLQDPTPSVSSPSLNPKAFSTNLPKIKLQKFSGKIAEWPAFFDLFNSVYHNNNSLDPIEKFTYLLDSLENEPKSLISSLPVSKANYLIAYDILKNRYENKRLLASTYWSTIESIPKLKSDSASSLRTLLSSFSENLRAFKQLNIDNWDFALFHCLLHKLDNNTRKQFELEHSTIEIPSFNHLEKFLEKQCRALEASSLVSKLDAVSKVEPKQSYRSQSRPKSPRKDATSNSLVATSNSSNNVQSKDCLLCSQSHMLHKCDLFRGKSPQDRFSFVKQNRLCLNCLKPSHQSSSCPSSFSCKECQKRHHSLLHFPKSSRSATVSPESSPEGLPEGSTIPPIEEKGVAALSSFAQPARFSQVLLSTIQCEFVNLQGHVHKIRALVDPGSQVSFILNSTVQKYSLPRATSNTVSVLGIGENPSPTCGTSTLRIHPIGQSSDLDISIHAVIVPRICSNLPASDLDPSICRHISHLQLADPKWNRSLPVEMLLGADIYPSILCPGVVRGESKQPIAINSIFGWMVLGPVKSTEDIQVHSLLVTSSPSLNDCLLRFWETESVPSRTPVNPENDISEQKFCESLYRLPSGRFGVSLPFKGKRPCFVGSQQIADTRWLRLEKRLLTQPNLNRLYCEFMRNYLDSQHMLLFKAQVPEGSYFIPHHCVIKSDHHSIKIRVVFDASAKDHENNSLNDFLLAGPKLQADIVSILLRFRSKRIAFICDIRQMYRQILISPEDRKYQFIRYRESPNEPIQTYQLQTITYGVSAAPFLAIRTILQLAELGESSHPLASQALRNDLYVDDIVGGARSVEEAREVKNQLISLLEGGGFELRKWASNSAEVVEDLPPSYLQLDPMSLDSSLDNTVKILGLSWDASSDMFLFTVECFNSACTKRSILAQVARIYDPMGFLSPITLFLKRLIQHLWLLGLDWDSDPPDDVKDQWNRFIDQLSSLSSIRIPRFIFNASIGEFELHAFCDASRVGYAAVIFLRYVQDDHPVVRLLISKSKVAPLKSLSIPRLELCGAVLLANLVSFVMSSLASCVDFVRLIAWTDSSVVLTWVRSPPYKWKTFVSNRVCYIQERIPPELWRHVPGTENPADLPSRGAFPAEMVDCAQWWAGPTFLHDLGSPWISLQEDVPLPSPADLEEKTIALVAQTIESPSIVSHLLRFSSLAKIKRIMAYILRFVANCRSTERTTGHLTCTELHRALLTLTRGVQHEVFGEDIARLKHQPPLRKPCGPELQKLAPFVDDQGLLRVGGRLRHADLPFDTKHPLVLPQRHPLTDLVVVDTHRSNCHSGTSATVHLIRQIFWILSARRVVNRCIRKCNQCFRTRPIAPTPMMGDLPPCRVSQAKPFLHVGVDYGGPFYITMLRKRGARSHKAYVCLFICFTTKAVHIEVVSDLSTDAFLASLRRFISRRGRCAKLFSDCGTNFVGANRALSEFMQQAAEQEAIDWSFNPPSAPHFGGIWESGIKSLKTHLMRVVGNQILTFEELCTLTCQIEAVLNSRPLCSVSCDANDLTPLTPGHFLTLEPLSAPPDADLSHLNISRLSRWQLVQRMHQDFWRRWSAEYLHSLHQRSKWFESKQLDPIDIGTLVLIKDDNAPPLKWRLGRIVQLHPGSDNIARVATINTVHGTYKRPLVKLCALPNQ